MFELELPQDIQNHIAATEHRLWDELDSQKLKEESKKTRECILDPCHTVGCTSLYEKSVALFWVMKNLVGRVEWDHQSPDSDNSSLESWQTAISMSIHSVEASVKQVEDKIDSLTACLGFQFPTSLISGATRPSCPGSSQNYPKDLSYILL